VEHIQLIIQGGPKVGIQYIVNYCIPTFGPLYITNLKINTCPQTMFINPVSENEVGKVVKNLTGKCLSGFDGVMDFIVKKCVPFIKKPLANICNTSFALGIFPEIQKVAIAKPLHKKGNTGEVQNYRPISLLSLFSKIVEKLMYSRLMLFVTKK